MATVATAASTPSKRPAEESPHPFPVKKSASIFDQWNIIFVAHGRPCTKVIDIGMDQFRIAIGTIGKETLLATRGIGAGFAICQRGKTSKGNPIIGLCHTSNSRPIQSQIKRLAKEMIQRGTVEDTIQTAVIGGMLPNSQAEEDSLRDLAKTQPISLCLNFLEPPESESGLAVVVASDRILIAEEEKFLLYTTKPPDPPSDSEATETDTE